MSYVGTVLEKSGGGVALGGGGARGGGGASVPGRG